MRKRVGLYVFAGCLVSLAAGLAPQATWGCVWYPYTPIGTVSITAPADHAKICCGASVTCTCSTVTDTDKRVEGETTGQVPNLL